MYTVPEHIFGISRALGEETRFKVFSYIAEAGRPVTVRDLVEAFDMHHSAIRIHVNKLQEAGLITAGQEHERGAVGRPKLVFSPSPDLHTVSLPPRSYRLLAELMLQYAGGADGNGLGDFAFEWGRSQAGRMRTNGRMSIADAVEQVPYELVGYGDFSVSPADNDGEYIVTGRNCPFFELAQRHDPLVCLLHQNILRGMVEELSGTRLQWEHSARQIDVDPKNYPAEPAECRIRVEPLNS